MIKKTALFLFLGSLIFCGLDQVRASDGVRKISRDLRKALVKKNLSRVKNLLKELAGRGGKKAIYSVLKLIKIFPQGEETFYWTLVNGATSFQDTLALEELKKFILRYKRHNLASDLVFSLAHNPSPQVLIVLKGLLKSGTYSLKLMAVDQMGHIERTETVDSLLTAWKKIKTTSGDQTLQHKILRALMALTGERMGNLYVNWAGWWKSHRSDGLKSRHSSSRKTGTIVDGMDPFRKSEYEELKKMAKERVLVIKGVRLNYDKIQKVLQKLKIPHRVVTNQEFQDPSFSLRGVMIVLINCCEFEDDTAINVQGIIKLKKFASSGGYLFTEDWGLMGVLELAWPKLVKSGKMLKEQTVGITPARGATIHPYLRGVFGYKRKRKQKGREKASRKTVERSAEEALKKVNQTWQIDDESPTLIVKNSSLVRKLIVSQGLRKVSGHDGVCITFPVFPGKGRPATGRYKGQLSHMRGGRVLHVVSHFGKQHPTDDEFTIQNLVLNFMIEAKQRWNRRRKRR